MVRAHAIYAADPGLNPGWTSFAACNIPLSLPCFLAVYCLIKVSVPKKKKKVKEGDMFSRSLKMDQFNPSLCLPQGKYRDESCACQ